MKLISARKNTPTILILFAGLSVGAMDSATAAQLIYYNFDTLPLGQLAANIPVPNSGTLGGNGTLTNGSGGGFASVVGSGAGIGSGNAVRFAPAADGDANGAAPHIGTMNTLASLGLTSGTAYTVMAWAQFDSAAGDNMIFGQDGAVALPGGESLHLGTRNGNLQSGHWGDDVGPDQGINIAPGTGNWHHVTYTNDLAGTQEMWLDGAMVASGGLGIAGAFDSSKDLWLGTSNNGGSLNGIIDEVKVFNTQLNASEIRAAMVIPETGAASLMALALAGVMVRRRR